MSGLDGQVVETDFASHHIQGYARAALERGWHDARFSVPLISHVTGNLYQGGCIDGVRLPDSFAYVVSLYPWEKYELGPDTKRFEYEMFDSATLPAVHELHDIARRVLLLSENKPGKILVHCQAGLNRSGLITGIALVLDGMEPAEAIELLRAKRCPMVLCNAAFERYILEMAR